MNTQHDITVSGKPLNPPKPPAKPHMLLWIDTETTGLDPNQCELLEVGMQVTDMTGKHPHDSLHLIVHPDNIHNWANYPELLKAYEMHLANGLMLASAEAPKDTYDYQHTAWNIHEFLNDQLSQYTLHPAGTNVDFDLRQLDVHLSRPPQPPHRRRAPPQKTRPHHPAPHRPSHRPRPLPEPRRHPPSPRLHPLDGRLRDLATQTHLLETKVSSLGWMAGAGAQTLKSMTRAQAHLMLAECDLLDALEANEKKEKNNE